MFYAVMFAFASLWSFRTIRLLGTAKIRISRNWWYVSTAVLLLFLGSVWQLYLDLAQLTDSVVTVVFVAPASVLLTVGLYSEYRYWSQHAVKLNDYREQMDEVFETIIRLRRPDLLSDERVKDGLKKLMLWQGGGLSLAVLLAAVDEYEVESESPS